MCNSCYLLVSKELFKDSSKKINYQLKNEMNLIIQIKITTRKKLNLATTKIQGKILYR